MARKAKIWGKVRETQKALQDPSLTILLIVQAITIFLVAPSSEYGADFRWAVKFCVLLMAFISVFIVAGGTARSLVLLSLILGIVGFLISPSLTYGLHSEIIATVSAVLFAGSVSWLVGEQIYNNTPITLHKIRGAAVIYLNVALIFGYVDNLLAYIIPGAFTNMTMDMHDSIGRMIYFSLTTLTSTGYGDIVPVHPYARSLANFESVVGQFYMAILIGTLVGLHVSHRQKADDKTRS